MTASGLSCPAVTTVGATTSKPCPGCKAPKTDTAGSAGSATLSFHFQEEFAALPR